MARLPIPTWFYALVLVKKGDRFLLVEEHNGEWYLPAGRVEIGETLTDAAIRETLEEAGVRIELEGILRIEHSPKKEGTRLRVFFTGRPKDDRPPKSVPDQESRGARWVTLAEARTMRLRSAEVVEKLERLTGGAPVAPLEVLASLDERG